MKLRSWPALAVGLAALGASAAAGQTLFSDQTAAENVDFQHHADPDDELIMGAGGAWGDYNDDGRLDLYVCDRDGSNRLFRNDGNGFTNVANSLGVSLPNADSPGALWGDYDNDGDADLYVMNRGDNVMYRNDGAGVFTDVTAELGVECFGRTAAAVYGDYDNDGWLDLYVGNHSFDFDGPEPGDLDRADCLFHSVDTEGGRTFADVAPLIFPVGVLDNTLAHSAGFLDYDNDGDLDLFVVNEGIVPGDPTLLGDKMWRNDGPGGPGGWLFTDVTGATHTALNAHPMGLAIGDYNGDDRLDFAITDVGPNRLYHNEGTDFTERGEEAGVRRAQIPGGGGTQVGWGLVFLDFDLDGYQDLYVATGTLQGQNPQPNPLFQNNGDPPENTFTEVTDTSGANDALKSRTVIKGDYDGDGDEDLYVVNYRGPAHLYRNDQTGGDHLALELEGTVSNRDAIGARVHLTSAGLPDMHRMVQSGSTTSGGNDLTLYFGVTGHATVDSIVIDWPSGQATTLTNVATNQRLTITEDTTTIFTDGFESFRLQRRICPRLLRCARSVILGVATATPAVPSVATPCRHRHLHRFARNGEDDQAEVSPDSKPSAKIWFSPSPGLSSITWSTATSIASAVEPSGNSTVSRSTTVVPPRPKNASAGS